MEKILQRKFPLQKYLSDFENYRWRELCVRTAREGHFQEGVVTLGGNYFLISGLRRLAKLCTRKGRLERAILFY